MSDPAYLKAKFTEEGGAIHATFRVVLDNHLEEVWAALTEPAWLGNWLAPGEIEPRRGGTAKLDFKESGGLIESPVTAFEPYRLLEYSWSTPGEPLRPLRWTLEPIGPTTLLMLRLSVPGTEDAGRAAAGWAAHLEMLQTALIGVPTKFPFPVFKAACDAFRAQVEALRAATPKAGARA